MSIQDCSHCPGLPNIRDCEECGNFDESANIVGFVMNVKIFKLYKENEEIYSPVRLMGRVNQHIVKA